MREARSGEANGGGKKKLFIKVFMKLTLESMPLFLACKNTFLFSKFYESRLTKIGRKKI